MGDGENIRAVGTVPRRTSPQTSDDTTSRMVPSEPYGCGRPVSHRYREPTEATRPHRLRICAIIVLFFCLVASENTHHEDTLWGFISFSNGGQQEPI